TLPHVSRVAVLWHAGNLNRPDQLPEIEGTARVVGIQLSSLEIRHPDDLDRVFAAMRREGTEALITLTDATLWNHRHRVVELAALVLSTLGLFVTLALGRCLVPLAAEAQASPQVPRIGVLSWTTLTTGARNRDAFLQGLHALGYVEGQTIVLEERWAEGELERLPDLAAELVQLQVHVIVVGNATVARATSQATGHIPIVLAGGDAVGAGLIPNIARPD